MKKAKAGWVLNIEVVEAATASAKAIIDEMQVL